MALILHINFWEQGQAIERACQMAGELGVDGIEFRSRPGKLELDEYLDRIAAAYEKVGLSSIHFGGGPALHHSESHARETAVENFLRFYEEAIKRFQLTVCTLQTDWLENNDEPYDHYECHGSVLATEEMLHWQIEGLERIASFAFENGFRFGLETHQAYIHDLPHATMRLVRAVNSPSLGVVFDYGNIIGFATPPSIEDCLETLGDSLFHLHVKNSLATGTRVRQRCALSEGEINHRELLGLLAKRGYTGNFCIESPRKGDREIFARCDTGYFKKLLQETGFLVNLG